MDNKKPSQPSWGRFTADLATSTAQSLVLLFVIVAGGAGIIALFTYFRSEGVLVPALSALAGSVVLLLVGYLLWRPLVRFGYILLWLAIWLALTSLVLRLFAFGPVVGVLGVVLWLLVTAAAVFGVVATPELSEAEKKRQEEKWEKFFRVQPDERRVYAPQTCERCGATLAHATVVGMESRRVRERPGDGRKGRQRIIEQVAELRLCSCGQRTTATFPDA